MKVEALNYVELSGAKAVEERTKSQAERGSRALTYLLTYCDSVTRDQSRLQLPRVPMLHVKHQGQG